MDNELTAKALSKNANVDAKKWNKIPTEKEIQKTVESFEKKGIKVFLVENKEEALAKLKEIIPDKASVMNGSSTTLHEIGFVEYLKSKEHNWKNTHELVFSEPDRQKQTELRRQSLLSDYFISSVNAISQNGELVAADATGTRTGAFLFAAKHLVIVSGVNKITPNRNEALKRLEEYAFRLENERAKKVYGQGSNIAKIAIISNEVFPDRTTLILVKEQLGF